jgi:L-histidine Nalpha-methyltransferase
LSTRACSTSAPASSLEPRRPTIVQLLEPYDSEPHVSAFAAAVRAGLTAAPRTLPWSYFYDEKGSLLFDAICQLPEYYLTRVEDSILRRYAGEIVAGLPRTSLPGEELTFIELGSGSATKTQRLLAAGISKHGPLHYVPIDVSRSALEESSRRLVGRFCGLRITGYVADYRRGLERIMARAMGPRLIIFLGSSLGNYAMDSAAELLTMIGRTMRADDRLLLGTDMAKDPAVLEAAYDDAEGVTAAFNLNLLHRINRELGADFQVEAFRHRAIYRPDRGRVEMHLLCTRDQNVQIPAAKLRIRLTAGETIHTENSHKYTAGMLAWLKESAGFIEESAWTDDRVWFRLQLWRPAQSAG